MRVESLPRRLEAGEGDLERAGRAAAAIAATVLARDPGPLVTAASMSHYVFLGADVVVKLVDVGGHNRLDREIALAPHLPHGLGAPLLAHGRFQGDDCDVRYACFARVPGASPGVGLPGADAATAHRWAEQAVHLLNDLHTWVPRGEAERTLRESPVHEGFVGRAALVTEIERIEAVVPRPLLDGLMAIARRAPLGTSADVPVHADGDWGNWLADGDCLTLLDFERARYGEPADDWVLLAVTSGPYRQAVLDLIAGTTKTDPGTLRRDCEIREAAFIAEEIGLAVDQPARVDRWVRDLEGLVSGHRWW